MEILACLTILTIIIALGGFFWLIFVAIYREIERVRNARILEYRREPPCHTEADDEWYLKYEPLILEERRISPQRIIVTIKHRQDINSQSPVMTENDSAE